MTRQSVLTRLFCDHRPLRDRLAARTVSRIRLAEIGTPDALFLSIFSFRVLLVFSGGRTGRLLSFLFRRPHRPPLVLRIGRQTVGTATRHELDIPDRPTQSRKPLLSAAAQAAFFLLPLNPETTSFPFPTIHTFQSIGNFRFFVRGRTGRLFSSGFVDKPSAPQPVTTLLSRTVLRNPGSRFFQRPRRPRSSSCRSTRTTSLPFPTIHTIQSIGNFPFFVRGPIGRHSR